MIFIYKQKMIPVEKKIFEEAFLEASDLLF